MNSTQILNKTFCFRYIFKGNDRGRVVTQKDGEEVNEYKDYIDGRYIGAHEAFWSNFILVI